MEKHIACIKPEKYRVFVGSSERKRPFERHRHKWEDNIRQDLKEIGWENVDWIHLA
jgi:hypothetical protein